LPIRPNIGSADLQADVAEVRREPKPVAIVNAYLPTPRMTNTGMLAGETPRGEMIASTKRGLYCASFQCTEAYLIEDGRIGAPVKGATLIGDGPSALTRVTMIGDDFAFDPGVGVCGKNGQGVPVGVGQPSLKITGLTVGGTSV
jgi:TldD protein